MLAWNGLFAFISRSLMLVSDVQIAEATAQPFDYTNSSEDEKIQKFLAVRGIAQAGGKEAAAPDVSTPMRAAANLVRKLTCCFFILFY